MVTKLATTLTAEDEALRAAFLSLVYSLGQYARRTQGKITVQTRLTNCFASILRGIEQYSPLLVRFGRRVHP